MYDTHPKPRRPTRKASEAKLQEWLSEDRLTGYAAADYRLTTDERPLQTPCPTSSGRWASNLGIFWHSPAACGNLVQPRPGSLWFANYGASLLAPPLGLATVFRERMWNVGQYAGGEMKRLLGGAQLRYRCGYVGHPGKGVRCDE